MPLPENDRLLRKLRKKLRQIEHLGKKKLTTWAPREIRLFA